MPRTLLFKVLIPAALVAVSPAGLGAQRVPPPSTPAGAIQQMIDSSGMRSQLLARLRASGLTPAQIRARLAQLGYDPSTLDPYLGGDTISPNPSANVVSAARAMGLLEMPAIDAPTVPGVVPDRVPIVRDSSPEERRLGLRIFGLEVFERATSQFQPLAGGPVPGSYVLGPGDELVLILTGDAEATYSLPVTREGFIVIPQVGQVWVNGVTMDQLRDRLYGLLSRVYSGVRRGPSATTRFDLSLGRLRTSQVFVTGAVREPGAYLTSPLASAISVLYQAGGPRPHGAMRDVRIMRGGRVVARLDLYAYLVDGHNLDSVRLEQGDVLFVPPGAEHVAIRGEVVRPGIYELKAGERLADLVRYAGGPTAPAYTGRARVTRVLPPAERVTPGLSRVAFDAPLEGGRPVELREGDEITVFAVRGEIRNTVTINGEVWQPGPYQFEPGMRIWDLVARAQGLTPSAYRARAHITRLNPADSTLSILAVALDSAGGAPRENPPLAEFDVVEVHDIVRGDDVPTVRVTGAVYQPQEIVWREGLTLRDIIVLAGGLRPSAHLVVAVSRLAPPERRVQGELATTTMVPVDSSFIVTEEAARHYLGPRDSLFRGAGGQAAQYALLPYDQVTVRREPDLVLPRTVVVTGEVRFPGRYVLSRRDEPLASVIERTGGLTPSAHAEGFRLYRGGRLVNVNLPRALRSSRDANNLILEPEDSLVVPAYSPIVTVTGAVNAPATVLYRPGAGLDHYIASAGGFARNADRGTVSVRYANGDGRVTGRSFLFFRSAPEPGPGSTVFVPAKDPDDRFDLRGFLADALQIVTTLTTLVIVATR
jgi:polysaccharide biosynthesis/export protein